ncbi:uncharacterized protein (DUF2267 family) [Lipingzhangella halophila]|uniref:Uncharacterized protein (DUF2267 family) n=1 Tax=Lipingzhangella halophila TaxID=1783352 RepID=A0A7W7RKS3_9ACTN|nr:DUF2267 domain-containing protein [Lipingzhangella halophila]MBB4933607.1 uncharacterized protein (DUF2267 family) [Lipingzhangella halophila]
MQHDIFIGQVQARGRLDSRGAAESATRATLETLAERLPPDLAEDLAAQLPVEIGEHVRRVTADPTSDHAARFGQGEFVARLSERAYTDEPEAAHLARVVFELLDEATTGGIMTKVRNSLPDDLREFSRAGSSD